MKKKISNFIFLMFLPIVTFLTLGIFLVSGLTSGFVSALSGNGGGFFVGAKSTLEISNGSIILGNSAENGGGVYVTNGGTLILECESFNINDIVSFGSYPMTIKEDSVSIITSDVDSNGYFLGSDGERYAKLSAQTYDSSYVFSNGNKINNETEYYFKVEPVKWRILSIENGQATLLAENILDQHVFHHDRNDTRTSAQDMPIYSNDYYYSDIRTWLTSDFMNKLFTSEEQGFLVSWDSSIGYGDKIRLLSFEEAKNEDYGFKDTTDSDSARLKIATDFAIASNIALPSADDRHGIWWLCDKNYDLALENRAYMVYYTGGGITTFYVDLPRYGVVPTVTVELSALSKSSIYSNTAGSGGGVCNQGTFIMSGGSIKDNSTSMEGGGVYNNGTFTMNGGSISSNTSIYEGGGICNSSQFVMNSGLITGNFGNLGGGGVCNQSGAEFIMNNGQIYGNSAGYREYGDDIINYGSLTINDGIVGVIDDESETFSIYNTKTININGGKIYGKIYSSTSFNTKMGASIKGSITLGDDAKIVVEDYAGITPTYDIVVSNSRMNGVILTFKGSSIKPVLERLNITGYIEGKKSIEVAQNSDGEWEVLLVSEKYEVSLNPINGTWSDGTTEIKKQEVSFGETYGELPIPTKTGHTFDGWSANYFDMNLMTRKDSTCSIDGNSIIFQTTGNNGAKVFVDAWNDDEYLYQFAETTNTGGIIFGFSIVNFNKIRIKLNGSDVDSSFWFDASFLENNKYYLFTMDIEELEANYVKVSGISICQRDVEETSYPSGFITSQTEVITACGHTFFAHWTTDIYTITLDNQSATTSGTSTIYEKYGAGYYSNSTATTSISSITVPTKTGYTFGGYYTETGGSGTQIINASGSIIASNTKFTSNTTIHAKWTINSYTVTLNKGAGISAVTGAGTYVYGTSVQISATVKSGYTWSCWTGSSTILTQTATITISTSNISLTANATANTYSVSFDTNGGICNTTSKIVTYDSAYGDIPTPTRVGYTFNGWSKNWFNITDYLWSSYATLSGTQWTFAPETTNSKASIHFQFWDGNGNLSTSCQSAGWAGEVGHFTTTFTKAEDMKQAWVRLNADKADAIACYDISSLKNGEQYVVSFDILEYSFNRIVVDNIVIEKNDSIIETESNRAIITSSSIVATSSNHTLFARWTANNYTLSFDANSGEVSETSKTVTYGKNYSDFPKATKVGCEFGGWFAEFDGTDDFINFGRDYMFEDKISIHLEAYATSWKQVQYQRLISCTDGGGWNIEGWSAGSEYVVFTAYDKGVGYKSAISSIKWESLSDGWHTFDMIFDGTYLYGYIDGEKVVTSTEFSSGMIGYNATNAIMVGAETSASATVPEGYYFQGCIGNVVIQHSSELFSRSNVTTWTIPAQNLTLKAKWNETEVDFIEAWKDEIASTTYMSTTVTATDLTSIIFSKSVPSDYNQIGTLSTGLKVFQSSSDATKIAFVNGETIFAPVSCANLFSALTKLETLTFSNFNTSKTTNMNKMFFESSALTSLDLSEFNKEGSSSTTKNVTSTVYMFGSCTALESINFTNFNTEGVTYMSAMFHQCQALKSLDLSSFSTSNVDGFDSMFYNCKSMTSLNISSFDTSKATYMSAMFSNCQSLVSLDLSNFSTPNANSFYGMFNNCKALKTLSLGINFKSANATSMQYMFNACSSLTSLDCRNFNTTSVTTMSSMFSGCSSLTTLQLWSGSSMSRVENMSSMFSNCSKLKSLNLSGFSSDLSSLNDVHGMFYNCSSLETVGSNVYSNIINFNTLIVYNMSAMFSGCRSLTNLNFGYSFDTSNVQFMNDMFRDCQALKNLSFGSYFKTSNVQDFTSMFYNCKSLVELDLSGFSMDNGSSHSNMLNFGSSSALRKLKTPTNNNQTLEITCGSVLYDSETNVETSQISAGTTESRTLVAWICVSLDDQEATTSGTKYIYEKYGMGYYSSFRSTTSITSITIPKKTGYAFCGYYTEKGGNGDKIIDSTGSIVANNTKFNSYTEVYAHWALKTYKITLDNQEATTAGTSIIYEEYGTGYFADSGLATSISSITVPTKTGYTFGGYYTGRNGAKKQIINSTGSIVDDGTWFDSTYYSEYTIYAYWNANQYKVTFDANGGTCDTSSKDVTFDSSYGSLPTPTKTGYDFNGWFTSSTGGTQVSEETIVSTLSDHTLYAHWTVKTIKITLDKTGGTGGTDYFYFKYGTNKYYSDSSCTTEITTLELPTKSGYTFSHYYGDGTCGGNDSEAYYWNGFGSDLCTDIYADATLYASWTANTYTVTFDSTGGVCDISSKDVTFDSEYGDLPTPTRVGYTFDGWSKNWFDFFYVISTDSNCTISGQTVTFQTSTNVSTTHVAVDKWKDGNYVSYGDGKSVTGRFYYLFTKDSSFDKLRIKLNGDKIDSAMFIDVSSLTDNHQYVLTFNVDTVELNHIVISNIMIEENSINQATDFTSEMMNSSSTVSIPSNHTLFARWTAINYSISFDANGGTCGTSSKTVTYGKTYSDFPTATSSNNNEFGGWFAEFDGTDDFINFGRDYMFEDKISIHLEAYSENWADVRYQKLISCAQGGGFNIEGYTYYQSEYVVFTAYDKGDYYKSGISSIKWSDLSAGWHTFDMVFDGKKLYGYVDGDEKNVATSEEFSSGMIGYNATNAIFVGAEAGSSQTEPEGEYFKGKIANVVIQHSSELFSSSNSNYETTWTIPAQNLTLKAKWNLLLFPTTWKTEIASSTYMTTTVNSSSVTEIKFYTYIPSGYNQIGTLSTGLKVYQDSTDSTKIAFISEEQIYAPESCCFIFGNISKDLTALKNIYFYNFDTSKVTNMKGMFESCKNLINIYTGSGIYSNFNTSNVTDMSEMFSECSSLSWNPLPDYFDTSKVTTMKYMFYNCGKIGNISRFNTSNVENMNSMFEGTCPNTLDLSSFDMGNVSDSNASDMLKFRNDCTISLLKTPYNNTMELKITVQSGHTLYNNSSNNAVVTSVPAGTEVSMIYSSSYDLSADTENVNFTSTWTLRMAKFEIDPGSVKSIIFDKVIPSGYELCGQLNTGLRVYKSSSDNTKIAFVHDATIIYSGGIFSGMNSLEEIIFNNFDTSESSDMSSMFEGCSSLTKIDVSSFNTSSVTDMSSMFEGCSSLTEIDVSSFNTSSVKNVSKMFYGCSKVKTINMKERVLTQITKQENICDMFLNCPALDSLYLPKFYEYRSIYITVQHEEDGKYWNMDTSTSVKDADGVYCYEITYAKAEFIDYHLYRTNATSSFTSNTGLSNLQVDQLTDTKTIENVSVVSQIEEDQSTLDVLISDEKKKYFIRKIKNIADDD